MVRVGQRQIQKAKFKRQNSKFKKGRLIATSRLTLQTTEPGVQRRKRVKEKLSGFT